MRSLLKPLLLATALGLSCSGLFARFTESLDNDQWVKSGLARLSSDQVACIDAIVQREIKAAKDGNTKAFRGEFSTRRTDTESQVTGLDDLFPEEVALLNTLVATRIAESCAPQSTVSTEIGTASVSTVETEKKRLEVHGEVSVFVGSNFKGGSMYGGSFLTTLSDPDGKYEITIGYSEVRSKGMGCFGWTSGWDDCCSVRSLGVGRSFGGRGR